MPHTVLLVDDDANLLAGLERALHGEPYQVLVAMSAQQAFDVMGTESVDVIVSDETMPGMCGIEFLSRTQLLYPDTIRILLTGNATLELAIRAINEGNVYRFLTKPCNPYDLALTIRHALQHRDLLVKSRQLLHTLRRQSAVMEELESEANGITHVKRDESGAVVVDDVPTDLDALLRELEAELEATDGRLRQREAEGLSRAKTIYLGPLATG